jgi:hypothetical protein
MTRMTRKRWNRAKWLGMLGRDQEELHQRERLETGQDPDEYTIWHVLCPAIRKGWTKAMERDRRAYGRRLAVTIQEVSGKST